MKITRRNAVFCLLWLVFVLSLPIYVLWTVFNYEHLCSWNMQMVCCKTTVIVLPSCLGIQMSVWM